MEHLTEGSTVYWLETGERRTLDRIRESIFYGPSADLRDNDYTSTVVPRNAVCCVPEGHIGNPCLACGFNDRK